MNSAAVYIIILALGWEEEEEGGRDLTAVYTVVLFRFISKFSQ